MGKLYLITGDIIENSKGMDAIVNTQNRYMRKGAGICKEIYKKAGDGLIDYCQKNQPISMETCEVRITSGFNLNMDIIHCFTPRFNEWNNPINKLIEAYNNVLNTIKNSNYKKIIMPSLGTDINGYKHEDIAEKVINLLYNFCINNDVEIYFVNRIPLYTNEYLLGLLNQQTLNNDEILDMLLNENSCYDDFLCGRCINYFCFYEKKIFEKIENKIKRNRISTKKKTGGFCPKL